MSIAITCWRARIGCFNCHLTTHRMSKTPKTLSRLTPTRLAQKPICPSILLCNLLLVCWLLETISVPLHVQKRISKLQPILRSSLQVLLRTSILLLLLLSGNVHPNPGPTSFNFMHYNVNSLKAHTFSRVRLIESFISIQGLDLAAITETALGKDIEDNHIEIDGFNILRKDLTNNSTHGGVLVYIKNSIAYKHCPDLEFDPNVLVIELHFGRRRVYLTVLYRRPSQTIEQVQTFTQKLNNLCIQINNKNPYASIFMGDFNAHNSTWWSGDSSDSIGIAIDKIFADNNLTQLVNEPTHIRGNSASCIDLVATSQPNLFSECSIQPSLHTTCHHQINYCKLLVDIPPPNPYNRRVWHYNRSDTTSIRSAINSFDWDTNLNACSHDVDAQANLLTNTLLNIFNNFIPFDDVLVKPKEPPWMQRNIKTYFNRYRRAFKDFISKGRPQHILASINEKKEHFSKIVTEAREKYFHKLGDKLKNSLSGPKAYHSSLKKLMGKTKFSVIPPILSNGSFITSSLEKAKIFNTLFANQCTTVDTDSTLPNPPSTDPQFKIENITLNESKVKLILKLLNPNKSHGWDNISIRMIKMCGPDLAKPLVIIYKNCLAKGVFPSIWKKANVLPIHKKDIKHNAKNYRPISLLPIFGKILEKIIFDDLYAHFFENNIISEHQSGFRKGDSTIKQLLSICHDIYKAFDQNPPLEARGVFLDISKAFDKVWHAGLLFKLHIHGVSGKLYSIISSFLEHRYQRVTIEGVESPWHPVAAGVPQGSILGPLLFLVYINDLLIGIESNAKIFADDTSLFKISSDNTASSKTLNDDLGKITKWAHQWKMVFNPDLTKQAVEVVFSSKSNPTTFDDISFHGIPVKKVGETKHLGLILHNKLLFEHHVNKKIKSARQCVGLMKQIYPYVPRSTLEIMWKMYARPHVDYCDIIFHIPYRENPAFLSEPNDESLNNLMQKIESVQYDAALSATGAWRGSPRKELYENLGWESLNLRRELRRLCMLHEIITYEKPTYLFDIIKDLKPNPRLRGYVPNTLRPMPSRTDNFKFSFFPSTIERWNCLDNHSKELRLKPAFKNELLKRIRPKRKEMFGIVDRDGQKWLTQLRVRLSPLHAHKFHHNFADTVTPMCLIHDGIEDSEHFLLHCRIFASIRSDLLHNVSLLLNQNVNSLNDNALTNILIYGSTNLNKTTNKQILNHTISFIRRSNRFNN